MDGNPSTTNVVLRIERSLRWQDIARRYDLLLDGENIGQVASRGKLQVHIEPGEHTLQAKIDWTGSPVTKFQARPGSLVVAKINPARRTFRPSMLTEESAWLKIDFSSSA